MSLTELAESVWYDGHPLSYGLLPLSCMYRAVIAMRKTLYSAGLLTVNQLDVPVIVIGNIAVGGTGKSPLTIWLARYLQNKGRRPGIVSRGYGGKLNRNVQQVRVDSSPQLVGDEPVMIARKTQCPVAIGKDRTRAALGLIEHQQVDVIICDDGLQHLALGRDIEIAVVDGIRRHGNRHCLPAGPLREPLTRLKSVDFVVANARAKRGEYLMEYEYAELVSSENANDRKNIEAFSNQTVHAVCGIGSPDKFFSYLLRHDIKLIRHRFPDHHRYKRSDLQFNDDLPIVMTEKDAVKCEAISDTAFWYLPIEAHLADTFQHRLDKLLQELGIG